MYRSTNADPPPLQAFGYFLRDHKTRDCPTCWDSDKRPGPYGNDKAEIKYKNSNKLKPHVAAGVCFWCDVRFGQLLPMPLQPLACEASVYLLGWHYQDDTIMMTLQLISAGIWTIDILTASAILLVAYERVSLPRGNPLLTLVGK